MRYKINNNLFKQREKMQYLKMLPYQIREAIDNNVPVVLPMGVVEYHA